MKINSQRIVMVLVMIAQAISLPVTETTTDSSYIVFLHDDNGGRSFFGSYDELIAKHSRLIDGHLSKRSHKPSPIQPLPKLNGYIAVLGSAELVKLISKQPETVSVEADRKVHLDYNVTIAGRLTKQTQTKVYSWGLDRIDGKLDTLFTYPSSAGTGVTVFVIDTGVTRTHLDFEGGRALPGKSFVPGEDGDTDNNGHGTHVAGTCVGQYSGVAKKALVQPVKVLDKNGEGSMSGIVKGLNFVIESVKPGQKGVVNLSLGGSVSKTLNAAVSKVVKAGIPVVVAAGNENQDACNTSPASEPMVISVGATTKSDSRASFSNYGQCVDLHAPGVDIVSSNYDQDDSLATMSGTSMASPHVAGIVAVMLSEGVKPGDIRQSLISNSQKGIIKRLPADTVNILAKLSST